MTGAPRPGAPAAHTMPKNLKHLPWALATLATLGWAWTQRHAAWVEDLFVSAHRDPAPVKIKFDNGTVRDTTPASGAAPGVLVRSGLKKCVSRDKTVYTDGYCPPGSHEDDIKNGTVNVTSGAVPKPAATGAPAQTSAVLPWLAAGGASGPAEPSIRDKQIDAAVNR
jgi:hypothetical protein